MGFFFAGPLSRNRTVGKYLGEGKTMVNVPPTPLHTPLIRHLVQEEIRALQSEVGVL